MSALLYRNRLRAVAFSFFLLFYPLHPLVAARCLLLPRHLLALSVPPSCPNRLTSSAQVFNYALENTTGEDLSKILWLKSRNSEAWLARRTTYTRSLALMSMVGYILGLGDRCAPESGLPSESRSLFEAKQSGAKQTKQKT